MAHSINAVIEPKKNTVLKKRLAFKKILQLYFELSKSSIVFLVIFTTACGYIMGDPHKNTFPWIHFLTTLLGVGCLAASSCTLNQIQERFEDSMMKRTKNRPLPSGRISYPKAFYFCLFMGSIGLFFLYKSNFDVFLLGILCFFLYNGFYTLYWKPKLAYAAIPGAIPGALPIFMGFVASSKQVLSLQGTYLFCILFFWQMPHFWALALRYQQDYAQGGFPTLPVSKGENATVHAITLWCLGYIALMHISLIFFPLSIISMILIACINAILIKALFAFRRFPTHWLKFFLWVNFSLILFLTILAVDRLKYQILRILFY